ncbi:single-stranded DNA-binding protein (plasmid) [Streptomyces sp. NBC_01136]|uniref:single-stranded DNA-binding protein n=1 Tax=Streptomyces sp. NBC_01136 TaxID=2903754 RepID=UPI0037DD7C8F|nr:single-stranded DNA-binding protein [Streptomyces sp. NBC_01136]
MSSTPITIVGNLTDDPELRFTPSGSAVVKFSVAVNRQRYNRQTDAWEDAGTDFHRVTAWNYLAQNVAETLTKGSRVLVFGELRQSHWTDEKTQEKRSGWDVTASAVGPELTFATAKVSKVKTRDGQSVGPDDPWNTAATQRPAAAAGASRAPGAWPTGSAGAHDEPPF